MNEGKKDCWQLISNVMHEMLLQLHAAAGFADLLAIDETRQELTDDERQDLFARLQHTLSSQMEKMDRLWQMVHRKV